MRAVWCDQCGCKQSLGILTCGDRNAIGELRLPYAISFFLLFLWLGVHDLRRFVPFSIYSLCIRCQVGSVPSPPHALPPPGHEGRGAGWRRRKGGGMAGVARSRPVAMARGGHVARLTRGAGLAARDGSSGGGGSGSTTFRRAAAAAAAAQRGEARSRGSANARTDPSPVPKWREQ